MTTLNFLKQLTETPTNLPSANSGTPAANLQQTNTKWLTNNKNIINEFIYIYNVKFKNQYVSVNNVFGTIINLVQYNEFVTLFSNSITEAIYYTNNYKFGGFYRFISPSLSNSLYSSICLSFAANQESHRANHSAGFRRVLHFNRMVHPAQAETFNRGSMGLVVTVDALDERNFEFFLSHDESPQPVISSIVLPRLAATSDGV